jgi:signal transduction histidine kinase
MYVFVLMKLLCCLISAMLASAIIVRDSGLRVNRLLGTLLACGSYWSLCEVLWNIQSDPEVAVWMVRLSSLGWMFLGPVCLDIFVELLGAGHSWLRRLVPVSYATTICGILLYVGTPLCVVGMTRTAWGWEPEFGFLFPLAYSASAFPVCLILLSWRRVYPRDGSHGERGVWRALFLGVLATMAAASLTDSLLPYVGVQVPPLGSTCLAIVGVAVGLKLRRVGYSLFSPAAFAREILGTLRDGVALVRADGCIREANSAFERLVGVAAGGLNERALDVFLPVPPVRVNDRIEPLRTELATASGQSIPVLLSGRLLRDPRGAVLGEAVMVRDLREVSVLRDRLVTSGRLAVVGELSAGIGRAIKRPLARVRDNLEHLRELWERIEIDAQKLDRVPDLDIAVSEGDELIDECFEGVDRVKTIVRDAGGIAADEFAEPEVVDVNPIVETALREVHSRIGPGVQIERRFAERPLVYCVARELGQVVINLLLNALHVLGEKGVLRLLTECRGDRVILRVEDDGGGIAHEIRDRIFDPFFTTKPVGEGTGLGLAISYHIVRKHGGDIGVESEPGRGTAFVIELPAAAGRS